MTARRPRKTAMARLKTHFLAKLKKGQLLTSKELSAWAKKQQLVNYTEAEIKKIRREWKFTAMFERVKKPSSYMATTTFRYGVCQIDLAFMPRSLRQFNDDCWCFIVCVEVSSLQVALAPIKNKTSKAWNDGIAKIVQNSTISTISTILSDRERALTSKKTIANLWDKFSIRLSFLKARHKAYYAELFISIVKKMLGMAMEYARKLKDPESDNWLRLLPMITRELNGRLVPGTTMKRSSINAGNFIKMLGERTGGTPYAAMNLNDLPISALLGEGVREKLFKHKIGELVLVDKRALGGVTKRARFEKSSLAGGYDGGRPFRVKNARLKYGGRFTMTPVYQLKNPRSGGRTVPGWFYEKELLPVPEDVFTTSGSSSGGASSDEEAR